MSEQIFSKICHYKTKHKRWGIWAAVKVTDAWTVV